MSDLQLHFFKGNTDILAQAGLAEWDVAASRTKELISEAMNAQHLAFLFGSGCSTYKKGEYELGIPTMGPLAQEFLNTTHDSRFPTKEEQEELLTRLGIDLASDEFASNLERLVEVLHSARFLLLRSTKTDLTDCTDAVDSLIQKVTSFVCSKCTEGKFSNGDETVLELYQAFYRRLIFRERTLPQPWVFTTNYDLFNETALDRLGVPYCNGFSGVVERQFNPANFRYTLAQQLDVTGQKWTSVDGFVYLCKLHGSVNWIEQLDGLFPIREISGPPEQGTNRTMIYPTPTKQNASFGFPYSDLLREFQLRVVREQSVLIVVGYGFGDEHINNLIFRALTIPSFRLIIFANPESARVIGKLKALDDPRIWIIGGDGPTEGSRAHYFDAFVDHFMPEPSGQNVDNAVTKVFQEFSPKTSFGEPRK